MRTRMVHIVASAVLALPFCLAFADSIPEDQIDQSKIYYGNAASFSSPAEIDIEDVIKATPEYDEIVRNKIERGKGKYWILQSQATNRAIKAISDYAAESDYDLIAEVDYLGDLDPAIGSDDITEDVIEKMNEG